MYQICSLKARSYLFILLSYSCLLLICDANRIVPVGTGDDLADYLCGSIPLVDSSTLILNHSIEYLISQKHSCQLRNMPSLTISSDMELYHATVKCITKQNYTNPVSTTSFAFVNMSVSIQNVKFNSCGAYLSRFDGDLISDINSSASLYFLDTHAAFFIFVDTAVNFSNVDIFNYFGFGILGVNLKNSIYFNSSIAFSLGQTLESTSLAQNFIGSGMLLLFTAKSTIDTPSFAGQHYPAQNIIINQVYFHSNYESVIIKDKQCVVSHFKCYSTRTPCSIINSAALTVIFHNINEMKSAAHISIEKSLFEHNSGSFCSGVLVLMLNSTFGLVKITDGTNFIRCNNIMDCLGGYLSFFATNTTHNESQLISPLIVSKTNFKRNGLEGFFPGSGPFNVVAEDQDNSAVLISIHHCTGNFKIVFKDVLFTNNKGAEFGASLAALVYGENSIQTDVHIVLESVCVTHNGHVSTLPIFEGGIFSFYSIDRVTINGTQEKPSIFSNNNGSVILARNTAVHIRGFVEFINNTAYQGPAFLLHDSTLYFENGVNVLAFNNSAKKFGGVIYALNFISYSYELPNCVLQFENNITCNFLYNSAEFGGSSIFAFPISSCYSNSKATGDKIIHSLTNYDQYFNFTTNSSVQNISTFNRNIKQCNNTSRYVSSSHYYPGQRIPLWVYASGDETGTHVFAEVRLHVVLLQSNGKVFRAKSDILNDERIQIIKEMQDSCSMVNATIAFKDYDNMNQYLLGVAITSIVSSTFIPFKSTFFIKTCPYGFALNHTTGYCDCSSATRTYLDAVYYPDGMCDIKTLTISRPGYIASPWIGTFLKENKTVFGITDLCPFDYCTSNNGLSGFKYNITDQRYYLINNTNSLDVCRKHREGIICGKCQKGYSVVFGSSQCKKCSNLWLLTIVLYIVSGPLILLVLYGLNLTLTDGSINGIIFFGQTSNFNVLPFLDYFPSSFQAGRFISVFLSLLNFNLGFPLCFFDGMTEVHKIGLTLIFPLYLFAIICVVVLASRYSTWLSNRTSDRSIQVFVTVVHISIAKLIVTVMDVFTTTKIYVDDVPNIVHVWYRDPNPNEVQFIALKAFVILVTSMVLIPYLLLLIGGRWLLRFTFFGSRFRAIYEAIHGPYKENRKYWFLARLIFLMYMFIVYSIWRGDELHFVIIFTLTPLIIFVVLQEYLKPFKNKLIGVLDSFIMVCMIMLYLLAWYQSIGFKSPDLKLLFILMSIPVCIVFMLFVLVILRRVFQLTRLKIHFDWRRQHKHSSSLPAVHDGGTVSVEDNETSTLLKSDTIEIFPGYREPLLSFDDTS